MTVVYLYHIHFSNTAIYLWLCSTHEIKCTRSQLWTSRVNGKQNFISADGIPYGWPIMVKQLDWDQKRGLQLTALTPAVLYLDGWAKMNASLAKAPFHQSTLDEGLEYICSTAGINILRGQVDLYENDPNCFRPTMFNGSKGLLLGMFAAQLEKAKRTIMAWKNVLGNAYLGIMQNVATLEYQSVTHDILLSSSWIGKCIFAGPILLVSRDSYGLNWCISRTGTMPWREGRRRMFT